MATEGRKIVIMEFILAVLAVWRLSHLVANEDGPWDVIYRIRKRLGDGQLGKLMDCLGCNSLWVSLPAAAYLSQTGKNFVLSWLSLSAGTLFLEAIYDVLQRKAQSPFPSYRQSRISGDKIRDEVIRRREW